jgi:phenylacetate-coenzyme A ligase PaaK-like adenylate-forming protein
MPKSKKIISGLFNIQSDDEFNDIALDVFRFQYNKNVVYKSFVDNLNRDINTIDSYYKIPFLPISFFKTHKIICGNFTPVDIFTSSGTTGASTSKHYVVDIKVYERSFLESFKLFFGLPSQYVFLALLPSYLERGGSSLIYMADRLIKLSSHRESGFYLNEYRQLSDVLNRLKKDGKKTILLGVTYALLDLAEMHAVNFPDLIIIETGGMKGKRKEMVRGELHRLLKQSFGVKEVYSEYGMTELLSQAYSKGEGLFSTPPWMKIIIRDTNDPFCMLQKGKTGGINVIDLANIYSCSFIETQDLGKMHENGKFEILGRFDI